MATITRSPLTTLSSFFQWRSLKTRITLSTLAIFLVGIWSLAFYSSHTLQSDMKSALGEQQFSTASLSASWIEEELEDRLESLEMIAARITPAILANPASMQTFLESQISFKSLFNFGGLVTRHDGITIADVPKSMGRIGVNYSDREWMVEVLKGKSVIGKPVIGRTSHAPILVIAVPIQDKAKVIGVLFGITDLSKPNFLTKIMDHNYGKTGGFLLTAPQHKLFVTATDKSRIMTPIPRPGINPLFDRYMKGFEGFGVAVNSLGVEEATASKQIPIAGWFIIAKIPTAEAFAPIHLLQQRMMLATIFLTLLAGGLTWWMLKRQLAPIFATIKTLATLSDTDQHPQLLPIVRQDEIGELIGSFNHLLGALGEKGGALRDSEARLRAILDATPFPIALVDFQDNAIDFWSRSALTLFGHTAPTAPEWYQIAYPDPDYRQAVIDRWKPFLEIARESGRTVNTGEYRVTCSDGSVRICELYATFLADKLIVTFNDITERKQADEQLKGQLHFLQQLIDAIPIPIFYKDRQGIFRGCNTAYEKFLGMTKEQIVGKTVFGIAPHDLANIYQQADDALFAHPGEQIYQTSFLHADGSRRDIIFHKATHVSTDGSVAGLVGVILDITERNKAEAALKESEERYNLAVRGSNDGIWDWNIITNYNYFSDRFCELLGYGPKEFTHDFKTWESFIHSEDRDNVVEQVRQHLEKRARYDIEYRMRTKNGEYRWVHARGQAIWDEAGNPVRMAGSISDITDRRLTEEEKVKLEAQNRQLMKSESLGRMAGAIAHTFNNQLAVVIGNLEMAIADLPQDIGPVNNLSTAMKAAGQAANMSGLMLTYLGQVSGNREPLDLSESCLRDLPKLRATMPENITMETDFPSPGPTVSADVDQIQNVLSNLLTNAWEAIGNDGGSIHLSVKTVSQAEIPTAHRRPIEWQPQNTAYACLEVADTGVGIADKDIESLFDPFFSSKFTGRGLGLAVVLGIIRSYGGVITVESMPGRGCKFQVFLPVSTDEVHLQPSQIVQPSKMVAGGTILLVEDEEMLRDMAASMVTRLGYSVIEAKDGVEAMEIFRQRRDEIRLVISDLTMPRMNGWETLTALRKLVPGIPAILASGYDKSQVMAGEHSEWPQVFLGKPYKLKELNDAISQALAERH